MAPDFISSRTPGLGHWLVHQAPVLQRLDLLFQAYCEEVRARGLPLWRVNLGVELLHPETSGKMISWTDGTLSHRQSERSVAQSENYLKSPVWIVDETDRPFRRRLDRPSPDLPMLDELREEGGTDYAIFPLPFIEKTRSAFMSFITRARDGFSETDFAELGLVAGLFSPYAERFVLRRAAVDLLETYVGPRSGKRIFEGHIDRGRIETIGAAICIADLRGFTRLADGLPHESVVAILDDWFECVVSATEANSGEILKFMGDGLLAIFPVDATPAEACERAFRAALAALDGVAALNERRAAKGEVALDSGLGLHLGDVAYGNVGGRRRLDFTVIGPAVNLASRLERLTRELDVPLLMSEAFASALGQGLLSLGHHPIRGLDRTEQVFAVPPAAPELPATDEDMPAWGDADAPVMGALNTLPQPAAS